MYESIKNKKAATTVTAKNPRLFSTLLRIHLSMVHQVFLQFSCSLHILRGCTTSPFVNQHDDFLHKLSTSLVNENQVICIENLRVKNMLKNSHLAKAISEVSWSEFRRMLEYKCDWQGKQLVVAGANYASSQLCSSCGEKNKQVKDLTIRKWTCSCGAQHDKDENAAKNILQEGKRLLTVGQTGIA